ncbi:MAG TPA: hypothetical protein VE909_04935 [Xanthobacteraceae bacterium]|nr:hypothetical protein [Xanthobacteraceae bacterium]
MSTFDDPCDPARRLASGCICGRHRSQTEHDHEARRMLQCAAVETATPRTGKRYEGVVVSAVLRAA